MLQTIKNIFGFGPTINYKQLIKSGAQLIDVRTIAEFNSGHIKGSLNIPLQILLDNLAKLKRDKPVIVCCASGMRSASAKNVLKSKGFTEVHNGGSWVSLQNKIS
ncbi:MAG TPA: rhodanese-like domain-containing protein [Pelobium sp.]|nr:rhodanese-like domain-containing protein [Pelobium sp.]